MSSICMFSSQNSAACIMKCLENIPGLKEWRKVIQRSRKTKVMAVQRAALPSSNKSDFQNLPWVEILWACQSSVDEETSSRTIRFPPEARFLREHICQVLSVLCISLNALTLPVSNLFYSQFSFDWHKATSLTGIYPSSLGLFNARSCLPCICITCIKNCYITLSQSHVGGQSHFSLSGMAVCSIQQKLFSLSISTLLFTSNESNFCFHLITRHLISLVHCESYQIFDWISCFLC